MKSLLIIAAFITMSFQDICQTPTCNIEQWRNFNDEYFFNTVLVFDANQTALGTFNRKYLFPNINRKDNLGNQIVITTEKLQIHTYRIQLLAHFNIIMSKNLKRSQHGLMASTNQL